MYGSSGRRAALVLALIAPALAAAAENSPPTGPLALKDAVERTLAGNPALQGFEYRLRAQQARAEGAALRPPLELRAEIENVAGTGPLNGIDAAETTLSLAKVIELGDKREQRIAAASAAEELLVVQRRAAQLDVITELTRRFIHVAADQEKLVVTRSATELAATGVDAAQRRVAAARAPQVEANRARIGLARAQIAQEHAEHELAASRRKLAAMWGETGASFERVTADLYVLPSVPDFAALEASLPAGVEALRFASETRLREAELRLAATRARPDMSLLAGVRRLEAIDAEALVLGFTLPLGAHGRARAGMEEARAAIAEGATEQQAHRVNALAQLYELQQELTHAVTEATAIRERLLPEMQAALEATQYAFERGRYGYYELAEAQRELLAIRQALIEAAASAHDVRAEIERLTGAALPGAP